MKTEKERNNCQLLQIITKHSTSLRWPEKVTPDNGGCTESFSSTVDPDPDGSPGLASGVDWQELPIDASWHWTLSNRNISKYLKIPYQEQHCRLLQVLPLNASRRQAWQYPSEILEVLLSQHQSPSESVYQTWTRWQNHGLSEMSSAPAKQGMGDHMLQLASKLYKALPWRDQLPHANSHRLLIWACLSWDSWHGWTKSSITSHRAPDHSDTSYTKLLHKVQLSTEHRTLHLESPTQKRIPSAQAPQHRTASASTPAVHSLSTDHILLFKKP